MKKIYLLIFFILGCVYTICQVVLFDLVSDIFFVTLSGYLLVIIFLNIFISLKHKNGKDDIIYQIFTSNLPLVFLLLVSVYGLLTRSKGSSLKTPQRISLKGVETALEYFYRKHDKYPQNIFVLYEKKILAKSQLFDNWGTFLDYKRVKMTNKDWYYLRSIGPDRIPDTADDICSTIHPWPKK